MSEIEILYQGLNWHIGVDGLYINNTEKEPISNHLYEVALAYKNKSKECETLKSENFSFEELIKYQDEQLEPFNDGYFEHLDTKTIAELAKKSIRLTTENRKLENALDEIEELCKNHPFCDCSCGQDILDIINKAKGQ